MKKRDILFFTREGNPGLWKSELRKSDKGLLHEPSHPIEGVLLLG